MKHKRKLKILLLTWEFPPDIVGGLACHVIGLSRGLTKACICEVFVLTANRGKASDYEQMDGVHVFRVAPFHKQESNFLTWIAGLNLAMLSKGGELFKQHQFDLIHAHDWLVGGAAIMLKKEWGVPLVSTIHSTEYGRNNGIHTKTQLFIHEKEQQLISYTDQIIVCSSNMRKELRKVFRKPLKDIVVIPNGVEIPLLKSESFRKDDDYGLPIKQGKRLIFSLGRIVPEKGFESLIEAASRILEKYDDIYFIIGGNGPMLNDYKKLINEKGLQNDVFLVGYLEEESKSLLYSLCELAIFPSLYEPFGIVALESMSYRKPTIVAQTGGLTGIIEHMKTGLFSKPGDQESIIEQIQFVLDHPDEGIYLGENGRKRVERFFDWEKISMKTKKIYDATIN